MSLESDGASEAGGLTGYGVLAFGVGHVIMEPEPEGNTSAGGASVRGDPCGVDVPFIGFAAQELDGASGVVHLGGIDGVAGQAVIDGCESDAALRTQFIEVGIDVFFITLTEAAAVDVNEHRRWLTGFDFVEVDGVALVGAVRDVFVCGFEARGFFGRQR